MFDHVGIRVSDLGASERFYAAVLKALSIEQSHSDAQLVEWEDWAMSPPDGEHPLTRGLHVAFRAPDRAAIDAFWRAAGAPAAGTPGLRTIHGRDRYCALGHDPDGNGVEALLAERGRPATDGHIDHVRLRVRDLRASRDFYATIAPHAALRLTHDSADHVQMSGEHDDFDLVLVRDGHPASAHVHLAFGTDADAAVQTFHAAALAAGYEDHGAPGERAIYHPGYYGAFVLDPDGHNVEVVNHHR